MSAPFREYDPDQALLFPPNLRDWLPSDHLVYFVLDLVQSLDLGAIYAHYDFVEVKDEQYGKDRRGDELPAELARRESRLAKIREGKAALEQEAKERAARDAEAARAKIEERRRKEEETGKKIGGHPPDVPDPGSRIMKDGATKGFEQAYNAQAAVDGEAQVIVASAVTQQTNDKQQLVPMLTKVEENVGRLPEKASADAGYFSEANVTDPKLLGIDLHVPPDRQKPGQAAEEVSKPTPHDVATIDMTWRPSTRCDTNSRPPRAEPSTRRASRSSNPASARSRRRGGSAGSLSGGSRRWPRSGT